ncbi:hypothetical protein XENTR_v10010018 [Xenopus tropicalis]|nr:hypothetical protein XENTR_v10010018 [Xenopus tropicalis]
MLLPTYMAPWQALLTQHSSPPNPIITAVKKAYDGARKVLGLHSIDPSAPLWGNKTLGYLAEIAPPKIQYHISFNL